LELRPGVCGYSQYPLQQSFFGGVAVPGVGERRRPGRSRSPEECGVDDLAPEQPALVLQGVVTILDQAAEKDSQEGGDVDKAEEKKDGARD